MRIPVRARAGIALLIVALAPLIYVEWRVHGYDWTPLDAPVLLKSGEFRTQEFRTSFNGRYVLSLAADRLNGPAFDREQCMMGVRFDLAVLDCRDVKQTVDFDWQVVSEKGEILQGGTYKVASISGSEIGFGQFQGYLDGRQALVLQIRQDAGELNGYHLRLKVDAGPEYREALPYWYEYSLLWAAIVAVVDLIVIGGGLIR